MVNKKNPFAFKAKQETKKTVSYTHLRAHET